MNVPFPRRKESAVESEFVELMKLIKRAMSLGFGRFLAEQGIPNGPYWLEQLERWIWEEHRELFPRLWKMDKRGEQIYGLSGATFTPSTPDPFSARLAGVERVIEELEKRQSIAQMEKGTR